jgi:hypothetical protein
MLLDELQQAWQSQPAPTLRIDADVLLSQVRRNQRSLKSTLFWRDFREVVIAVAMIPVFANAAREQGWHWLSFCLACAWMAGYILVDRWRRRKKRPANDHTLARCVDESLDEVEHQIWLLKNVGWWYLLPGMLAALITFTYVFVTLPGSVMQRAISLLLGMGVFGAVYAGVYWTNQYAVRTNLEPQRQELLAIRESLTSLDD